VGSTAALVGSAGALVGSAGLGAAVAGTGLATGAGVAAGLHEDTTKPVAVTKDSRRKSLRDSGKLILSLLTRTCDAQIEWICQFAVNFLNAFKSLDDTQIYQQYPL
jgi:hypothetical protein